MSDAIPPPLNTPDIRSWEWGPLDSQPVRFNRHVTTNEIWCEWDSCQPSQPLPSQRLHSKGPYNPEALLPTKLAKKS